MSNVETVNKIVSNLYLVNKDISMIQNKPDLHGFLTGDSAKLVSAAGVNVLSSRRQNLLEMLYSELHRELGYADGCKINEVV